MSPPGVQGSIVLALEPVGVADQISWQADKFYYYPITLSPCQLHQSRASFTPALVRVFLCVSTHKSSRRSTQVLGVSGRFKTRKQPFTSRFYKLFVARKFYWISAKNVDFKTCSSVVKNRVSLGAWKCSLSDVKVMTLGCPQRQVFCRSVSSIFQQAYTLSVIQLDVSYLEFVIAPKAWGVSNFHTLL